MEDNILMKIALKRNKILLRISLILLVIGIVSIGVEFAIKNRKTEDLHIEDLRDVLTKSGEKSDICSKVDVQWAVDLLSVYEDVFLAFDENNHGYILRLFPLTYRSLENNVSSYNLDKNATSLKSITIEGKTEEIPESVKKLAIKKYNKIMGKQIVDEDNFEDYIGSVCLREEAIRPQEEVHIGYGIEIMMLPGFVMFLICYLVMNYKVKRKIREYEEDGELERVILEVEGKIDRFDKVKVILTPNYIVLFSLGIDIIKYSKIVNVSKHIIHGRYSNGENIIIVTEDRKKHKIGRPYLEYDEYEKVYKIIHEKVFNQKEEKLIDEISQVEYTEEEILKKIQDTYNRKW